MQPEIYLKRVSNRFGMEDMANDYRATAQCGAAAAKEVDGASDAGPPRGAPAVASTARSARRAEYLLSPKWNHMGPNELNEPIFTLLKKN